MSKFADDIIKLMPDAATRELNLLDRAGLLKDQNGRALTVEEARNDRGIRDIVGEEIFARLAGGARRGAASEISAISGRLPSVVGRMPKPSAKVFNSAVVWSALRPSSAKPQPQYFNLRSAIIRPSNL